MSQHIGPRTISAIGGSIKRVGNYRIHTFPAELVTDGLVLNLDAGDPRSYPSSGTTWTDLSGNGNNASLISGATYSNANGGSIVFDGGTQYASIPGTSSAPWAFGQNGTVEQWVFVNGNNGSNNRFWCVNNNPSALDAYLNGSTYNIGFHGGAVITSSTIPQSAWTHLVVTYRSGTIRVYFNGIEQGLTGTTTGYNITNTSEFSIADFYGHGQNYELNGRVSAMRIYNRALSAAEVAQNYDALRVRYGSYTSTFTPICAGGEGKVEVLCVAGGGSGGGAFYHGGGGGAGGLIYNSAFSVDSNSPISLSVGRGGYAFYTTDDTEYSQGEDGANSSFGSLTSIGGGGGGGYGSTQNIQGRNGGSGGGAGNTQSTSSTGGTGTNLQGNAGGNAPDGLGSAKVGGGGGGAGSKGEDGTNSGNTGGNGGSGLAYSISGTSSYYAGGGGGSTEVSNYTTSGGSGIGGNGSWNVGTNGIPNTGSGGGCGERISPKVSGNGSNGTVIVRYPATDYNVEVLIVGGGGGGGYCKVGDGGGGGGGAGGLIYNSAFPVSSGKKLQVTVGSGGAGSTTTDGTVNGSNGSNSIFSSLISIGGGGGGSTRDSRVLSVGGSGGGAGSDVGDNTGGFGTVGQGNNGGSNSTGNTGAGGGGSGENGVSASAGTEVPNGGNGLAYSITGTSTYYAGGGGGGKYNNGTNAAGTGGLGGGGNGGKGAAGSNGTANTGGGGGGGGMVSGVTGHPGGSGGSGIVIIAYKGPQRGIGGTVDTTSRPGYTLHKFTTTGTDFFIP